MIATATLAALTVGCCGSVDVQRQGGTDWLMIVETWGWAPEVAGAADELGGASRRMARAALNERGLRQVPASESPDLFVTCDVEKFQRRVQSGPDSFAFRTVNERRVRVTLRDSGRDARDRKMWAATSRICSGGEEGVRQSVLELFEVFPIQ